MPPESGCGRSNNREPVPRLREPTIQSALGASAQDQRRVRLKSAEATSLVPQPATRCSSTIARFRSPETATRGSPGRPFPGNPVMNFPSPRGRKNHPAFRIPIDRFLRGPGILLLVWLAGNEGSLAQSYSPPGEPGVADTTTATKPSPYLQPIPPQSPAPASPRSRPRIKVNSTLLAGAELDRLDQVVFGLSVSTMLPDPIFSEGSFFSVSPSFSVMTLDGPRRL